MGDEKGDEMGDEMGDDRPDFVALFVAPFSSPETLVFSHFSGVEPCISAGHARVRGDELHIRSSTTPLTRTPDDPRPNSKFERNHVDGTPLI
jgi:hypothetical protein